MTDSWANFGADLHLDLSAGRGRRAGLVEALREAARSGRLAPGTRLPSSRSLAVDLGMARNTVADAYAELVAEGWLTARQGSGTRVAERARPRPGKAAGAAPVRRPERRGPSYSLVPGTPDLSGFPRAAWLAAARRALTHAPNDAFGYGSDARGRVELREALAEYLARVRGVYADPERIVLCAGFVQGLKLMSGVLRARRVREVAVEGYGLNVHRDVLAAAGLRMRPLPVDGAGGADGGPGGGGGRRPADAGAPVPDGRRADARAAGGGGRLGPQDGRADPGGRLRRGVPLRPAADRGVAGAGPGPGGVPGHREQGVGAGVADGVAGAAGGAGGGGAGGEGAGRVDVQRAGPADAGRVHAVGGRTTGTCGGCGSGTSGGARRWWRRWGERVTAVSGISAGLHAVLDLPAGTEGPLVQAAAWHSLSLTGLSYYRHPEADMPARDALVVGYGTPPDSAWGATLAALAATLP
ncbi:hypothetical protein GCM10020254_35670 [Streptomyces goshikiensis]